MKKILRIALLLLVCVLLFAACDDKGGDVVTTTTADPNEGLPPPPASLVLVNADQSVNYSVVIPNNFEKSFRTEVRDFIKAVKNKTGANAQMALAQENSTPANDLEITVNVTKNRGDDVAAVFESTAYNASKIEIVGTRIVVTSYSTTALKETLAQLLGALTQDASGNWVLDPSYSYLNSNTIVKTEEDWNDLSDAEQKEYNDYLAALAAIPKLPTANLKVYPLRPLAHDAQEVAFEGATKAEYDAYVAQLLAAGFTKYSERTISAGSDKPDVCNTYHIFTKDDIYVSTTWQGPLTLIRIVTSIPSKEELPSLEPVALQPTHTVTPTVAQMHITGGSKLMGGGGMSYVMQLADGKFIIVDGGVTSSFSEGILIEYLEAKAAEAGMAKPVIAMWIFSHAHGDHIQLATGASGYMGFFGVAKNRGYTIESIAYNFPNDLSVDPITGDTLPEDTVPSDDDSGRIWSFEYEIRRHWPNAKVYTPRAGQVYYFAGMHIEILSTEEDSYPLTSQSYHNGYCTTFRAIFEDGKSFMFLGDNTPTINAQLATLYGDYLKSDVLQMAHHGLTGGEITSYRNIDPDICLWPTTKLRFSGEYAESGKSVFETVQHTLGMVYQDGDTIGNPTKPYTSSPEGVANRWIRALGEYVGERQRQHYHNSQTTIVNALDLTVTIDSSHTEVWK